jgi:N-acyl homoserine lactone hydrolase
MSRLTIWPLHSGTLTRDLSTFTYLRNVGKVVEFPVIFWYIEGANFPILVDTAGPPPSEAPFVSPPYAMPDEERVIQVLARRGLRPEDIELVILTHLHWDHSFNSSLFPKARFLVQRAELRYAAAPLPVHRHTYGGRPPGTRAFLPAGAQVDVIDGDVTVTAGVSVALLPGHTPGLQGVVVETSAGTHLIASDNVPFYENWRGEPPLVPHIPSGLHVNLEDYFASFAKMERLADVILPSHDFKVLEQPCYPVK